MKLGLSQSFGLLVGSLALVGCSGTGVSEPELGRIPMVVEMHELVLPLDTYHYTPGQYLNIQLAAWSLIGDCVDRFGDQYTASEPTVEDGILEPFSLGNQGRYGLFDPESAALHGYNVAPELLQGGGKGSWNPSQDELMLVRGTSGSSRPTDPSGFPLPDGGCSGEANRILLEGAPDQPVDHALPNSLANESYEQAEADSRVRDAVNQWSECMTRSGYDYRSVWEPNNQDWPEAVSDEEIAVATADVMCKEEVNLLGAWLAVETAYQRMAIGEHGGELNVLRSNISTEAENAARILDAS